MLVYIRTSTTYLLLDAYIQPTLEGCCRGICGLLRAVALRGVFVRAGGYLDVCAVFQAPFLREGYAVSIAI